MREAGVYLLEFGDARSGPFRIAADVYEDIWQPTLDVFLPVQMDHMLVNEAYRVWHGASHLDDALQAPVDREHFDLYAQGPTTDSPYAPGEHIPGLNVGGWYDAGDYDIRTQTHYYVVNSLVNLWETFGVERDVTLVDGERRYVDLHVPDGKNDLLQQIRHGTLALVAQFRAVGHAIPGIVESDLTQYTHLGDGLTKTDNLVHDPALGELESDGGRSGIFDDRWAFTSRSSALNFGSMAALAAASRALERFDPELADEALAIAIAAWDEEQALDEPYTFSHGNTTGGALPAEELKAALELLVSTGERHYAERFEALLPEIGKNFGQHAILAVRALPYLDEEYAAAVRRLAQEYRAMLDDLANANPWGVLITEGGWAGNGAVVGMATANYYLHVAFPDLIGKEDVFRGLNYLLGAHPYSNLSFVSGVGSAIEAGGLRHESRRLFLHPRRRRARRAGAEARFPRKQGRLAVPVGRKRVRDLARGELPVARQRSQGPGFRLKPACGAIGFSVNAFTAFPVSQFQNTRRDRARDHERVLFGRRRARTSIPGSGFNSKGACHESSVRHGGQEKGVGAGADAEVQGRTVGQRGPAHPGPGRGFNHAYVAIDDRAGRRAQCECAGRAHRRTKAPSPAT